MHTSRCRLVRRRSNRLLGALLDANVPGWRLRWLFLRYFGVRGGVAIMRRRVVANKAEETQHLQCGLAIEHKRPPHGQRIAQPDVGTTLHGKRTALRVQGGLLPEYAALEVLPLVAGRIDAELVARADCIQILGCAGPTDVVPLRLGTRVHQLRRDGAMQRRLGFAVPAVRDLREPLLRRGRKTEGHERR